MQLTGKKCQFRGHRYVFHEYQTIGRKIYAILEDPKGNIDVFPIFDADGSSQFSLRFDTNDDG
ncbi:hypothetical protein AB4425_17285 [Vibrio sp. 10N.261.51.A1]|uniref:hypothetical protein n=1 Tax=unclassified Vibrio TaxID=2614977 RepID=UPI0035507BE8